jgi:feruloyl esterase
MRHFYISPALLALASHAAAADCAALADLDLPDTRITVAERVSGSFETRNARGEPDVIELPVVCRVVGVVEPAIGFEVWLPEPDEWNGRFQAVGGGGLAGVISHAAMNQAVHAGFASASTDTGHRAPDTEWMRNRQQMIDYGYRAIHEMTVKSKAIIGAYYGEEPAYSYFNGCSTGGRQGLMEAQRFPLDYDGIVSGAPVFNFTNLHIGQLWASHVTLTNPGAGLSREDLALVSEAALQACDAADGVRDGLLADPRTCDFDPGVLQCASGTGGDGGCLTAQQVDAVRELYQGPVNPRTGVQIYPGLEPGGEGPQPGNLGWSMIIGDEPFSVSLAVVNDMALGDPDFDWRSFDYDRDVELVNARLSHVLNAVDPDLREFKENGGKLIMWHGWNDPGVMPRETIDYYERLAQFAERAGESDDGAVFTQEYARLFMMPGVGHCRGGAGPAQADFMSALVSWVEEGDAPERIIASRARDGEVDMTRPLCPYPQVARYRGEGDVNDAASFECAMP